MSVWPKIILNPFQTTKSELDSINTQIFSDVVACMMAFNPAFASGGHINPIHDNWANQTQKLVPAHVCAHSPPTSLIWLRYTLNNTFGGPIRPSNHEEIAQQLIWLAPFILRLFRLFKVQIPCHPPTKCILKSNDPNKVNTLVDLTSVP